MREFFLDLYKGVEQIRSVHDQYVSTKPIRERRENVGIAVIDDEPFAPQQNLRNYGYSIIPIGDLRDVNGIAKYDIVLCDLMGVGQNFDNNLQGASIIKEIKRVYPEKFVLAYTGAAMNAAVARLAVQFADETIRKDIDIDEWVQKLDGYTNSVQNPYATWLRIRASLISRKCSTKDLLKLEDGYVRSVLAGDRTFKAMHSASREMSIRDDVRAIINGLISSAAFAFVFGS